MSRQDADASFERECGMQQFAIDLLSNRAVVVWPLHDGVSRLRLPDRTPVLCTTVTLSEPGTVVVESGITKAFRAELSRGTHMIPCGFLYSGAEGVVHANGDHRARCQVRAHAEQAERHGTPRGRRRVMVLVRQARCCRSRSARAAARGWRCLLSL